MCGLKIPILCDCFTPDGRPLEHHGRKSVSLEVTDGDENEQQVKEAVRQCPRQAIAIRDE